MISVVMTSDEGGGGGDDDDDDDDDSCVASPYPCGHPFHTGCPNTAITCTLLPCGCNLYSSSRFQLRCVLTSDVRSCQNNDSAYRYNNATKTVPLSEKKSRVHYL